MSTFLRVVTAALVRLSVAPSIVVVLLACSSGAARAGGEPDPGGVWPLDPAPQVMRHFDPPSVVWGAGHRGVDLAGRVGQPVHAALAGRISFAGPLAGKPVVVVDSGAVRTTYEPVIAIGRTGDPVSPGQEIGTLGALFSHCPPAACLHWGLIRNSDDAYLDPLALVEAIRVRLLPLWRAPTTPPHARSSGARMGLVEGATESVCAHVCIQLSGGQRRVAEQLLN